MIHFSALMCILGLGASRDSSQSSFPLDGLGEAPEWQFIGSSTKPKTERQESFAAILSKDLDDTSKIRLAIGKLDSVLREKPGLSDGYFARATLKLLGRKIYDVNDVVSDIDRSIESLKARESSGGAINLANCYSLRAILDFDRARYRDVLDDLDSAAKENDDSGESLFFGISESSHLYSGEDTLSWDLGKFDLLKARLPEDYRVNLYKGLYYRHFCFLDESKYILAEKDLMKASQMNPKSAWPPFWLGTLWHGRSNMSKSAAASESVSNKYRKKAVDYFGAAIRLNLSFKRAYEERANANFRLMRFAESIRDYDKVIELDPLDAGALSDRGLVKLESGHPSQAVLDFSAAIRKMNPEKHYLSTIYELRADAYIALGTPLNAIDDYSMAIRLRFGQMVDGLNLEQVRNLYPECASLSDDALVLKIQSVFRPDVSVEDLSAGFRARSAKGLVLGLDDLYAKRGDAYLKAHDYKHGVLDFRRVFDGMPEYGSAVDRWRPVGRFGKLECFIDVKTIKFPVNGKGSFWVKVRSGDSEFVQAYEVDVNSRMYRIVAASGQGIDGSGRNDFGSPTSWTLIEPESNIENWCEGLCSRPKVK